MVSGTRTRPSASAGYGLGRALARVWTDGRRIERVAYLVGAALFLGGLAHVVVLLVTGGSWMGPLSLRKPATFGLSFGLTLATAAWVTSFLTIREWLRGLLLGAFTVASVLETALITMQAWRGVPSHFNFETGFDSVVSTTLAAGGGLIVLIVVGFAAAAILGAGEASTSMRLAVRYGLIVLVLAMGVGAAMIASGVGEVRAGNPRLAYHTAGALKPIHGVAMHAVLVLPGLAWLLGFTDWTQARRTRLVAAGCLAYTVLAVVVGVESITGVSPFAAPPAASALSGAALIALAVLGGVTLRAVRRRPGARSDHDGAVPAGNRSDKGPDPSEDR